MSGSKFLWWRMLKKYFVKKTKSQDMHCTMAHFKQNRKIQWSVKSVEFTCETNEVERRNKRDDCLKLTDV